MVKVKVKKTVEIRGKPYKEGEEHEVEQSLAKWMLDKDIAQQVSPAEEKEPSEPYVPAYHKLLGLVGPHLIELYGAYDTGKSRLVHSIAVEAQVLDKKVKFIDTEAGLEDEHVKELEGYEYVGDNLDALLKSVSEVKDQREKWDLLIVDSVGHPVYVHYVEMGGLQEQLQSFQKLAALFRDMVRFARGEKDKDLGKRERLSIAVNHTVSEFARVAKDIPKEEALDPFGGQIHRVPKLILRSEPIGFTIEKSMYRLMARKARNLPKNFEVAQFTIDAAGVKIQWKV